MRIDKRRKFLASTLLLALDDEKTTEYRKKCEETGEDIDYNKINGISQEQLFSIFYKIKNIIKVNKGWEFDYIKEEFLGNKVDIDIIDSKTGKVYLKSGEKFNILTAKDLEKIL